MSPKVFAWLIFSVVIGSFVFSSQSIVSAASSQNLPLATLGIHNSQFSYDDNGLILSTELNNFLSVERTFQIGVEFHPAPTSLEEHSSPVYTFSLPSPLTIGGTRRMHTSFAVPTPILPQGKYRVFIGGSDETGHLVGRVYVTELTSDGANIILLTECSLNGRMLAAGPLVMESTGTSEAFSIACQGKTEGATDQEAFLSVQKLDGYSVTEIARSPALFTEKSTLISSTGKLDLPPGIYPLQILATGQNNRALGPPLITTLFVRGTGGRILGVSGHLSGNTSGSASIPVSVTTELYNSDAYTLVIEVSSNGQACGSPLSLKAMPGITSGTFAQTQACSHPTITATLLSQDDQELDRFILSPEMTPRSSLERIWIGLAVSLLVILMLFGLVFWWIRYIRIPAPLILLAFFATSILGWGNAQPAQALKWVSMEHSPGISTGGFVWVSFDKPTYLGGETVHATLNVLGGISCTPDPYGGEPSMATCWNYWNTPPALSLTVNIPGIGAQSLNCPYPGPVGTNGSMNCSSVWSFIAPNVTRTYYPLEVDGFTPGSGTKTYSTDDPADIFSVTAAAAPINGTCGSAHGQSFASAPNSGLCAQGATTGVSGTGPYAWACQGSGGGTDASCSANHSCTWPGGNVGNWSNGTFGSGVCTGTHGVTTVAHGQSSGLIANLTSGYVGSIAFSCYQGSFVPVNPVCTPLSGSANGACGPADGVPVPTSPIANLCSAGIPSIVTGSGPWTWTCQGSGGGTDASCSAPIASGAINGVCAPAHYDCLSGSSMNPFDGPTAWTWTCQGSGGGIDASCTENKAPACTPVDSSGCGTPGCALWGGVCECAAHPGWEVVGGVWKTCASPADGVCQGQDVLWSQAAMANDAPGTVWWSTCNYGPAFGWWDSSQNRTTNLGTRTHSWVCPGANGGNSSPLCVASLPSNCFLEHYSPSGYFGPSTVNQVEIDTWVANLSDSNKDFRQDMTGHARLCYDDGSSVTCSNTGRWVNAPKVTNPTNVPSACLPTPDYKICPASSVVGRGLTTQVRAFYAANGTIDCANTGSALDITSFVNWSSANPSIASVNNTITKGLVTGVNVGNTTISASNYLGLAAAGVEVSVVCMPSLTCSSPAPAATATNQCPADYTDYPDNGCGASFRCYGTRTCDLNYREIAP